MEYNQIIQILSSIFKEIIKKEIKQAELVSQTLSGYAANLYQPVQAKKTLKIRNRNLIDRNTKTYRITQLNKLCNSGKIPRIILTQSIVNLGKRTKTEILFKHELLSWSKNTCFINTKSQALQCIVQNGTHFLILRFMELVNYYQKYLILKNQPTLSIVFPERLKFFNDPKLAYKTIQTFIDPIFCECFIWNILEKL
ncbi:hypothetical protein BpHYR1_048471 [Brachionus plicatilis]|uniref:Uncharacterized protein n=1 Tax=Brachionus plicatilis TaxID=10195 RepID=A0A3M7SIT0_BRAPC|nr:hypothetical protein BpHYR1_048471 [Brachionus plicatilis]